LSSIAAAVTECGNSVGWQGNARNTTQEIRLLTKRGAVPQVCGFSHGSVQQQQWKCSHLAGARQTVCTWSWRCN